MFTTNNMNSAIGMELFFSPKVNIITHFKISKDHRGHPMKCLRANVYKASMTLGSSHSTQQTIGLVSSGVMELRNEHIWTDL